MKSIASIILVVVLAIAAGGDAVAVEGMFPVSGLQALDLKAAGLAIDPELIYDPDGLSLVDGICKLGGCTGSFVSDRGLILTNHHCAFRAIGDASTAEHDYLAEGFAAAALADEVPAVGYTVRITESYRDVSTEVLAAIEPGMDPMDRTRAIERRMKEISLAFEAENPGKRAEVSEMFQGRTYVLFVYTYLKDVRLVLAPPQAIGNFGGEADNWIWPRHSGDFSFMRAYTAPDGSPAAYHPDNVPYRPSRVLRVAQEGVAEGDFVFIFGYPGTTYRHRSSHYLEHLRTRIMPLTVDWYGWQIENLEALGAGDRDRELALASRVKSLQNTWKNYRGKLQGIARLDLVEARRAEEARLQEFIDRDALRRKRYGKVLDELAEYYRKEDETAVYELWMRFLGRSPQILQVALTVWENAQEQLKDEADREPAYMARNFDQTRNRLQVILDSYDEGADRLVLAELLRRGGDVPRAQGLRAFAGCLGSAGAAGAAALLDRVFGGTRLTDPAYLERALAMTPDQLKALDDPLLDLAEALHEPTVRLREDRRRDKGRLDPLQAALLEARQEFLGTRFIPDANGTLRFTYGYVEGYSPRDAVRYEPLTTTRGLLEKDTGADPYALPERYREWIAGGSFGPFGDAAEGGVPVGLLYSTDTTGGNSGSPVLDAHGRVVGLNFDRAWEATINDFAWDHSYSRSIGVDIRYVLWVTWKSGGGQRLLEEMGIPWPGADTHR
ncbi:S46 family peptidase [bacterium]|nr:S46 family peptidase [bacterium]